MELSISSKDRKRYKNMDQNKIRDSISDRFQNKNYYQRYRGILCDLKTRSLHQKNVTILIAYAPIIRLQDT